MIMAEYNVILKDRDGYQTVNYPIDGMPAARKRAKYLLSEEFAKSSGSDHDTLRSHKVAVQAAHTGECLWGALRSFRQPPHR